MINRRMILVSDAQNSGQHRAITSSGTSAGNTILDGKTQTVYTTSDKTTHFMSPIGSLQLTAEECNEILMKRAVAAVQNQQAITTTASDGHNAPISIQVQKVLQTLEDSEEQQLTHCKMEPNMSSSPKLETIEIVRIVDDNFLRYNHFETAEDSKPIIQKTRKNDPGSNKERPYACEQCGKTFLLKHHLTTHARSHTGERPHVCPHCGKDFSHKHCLNTHLLLHTTERPYQCGECKKCFTLKHHLLTHLRVHTRDRPFVCQECGRSFPLKRHLVTHSKFHAGERPFICEDCGESFAQKEHLDMHSRFHGSVNPFACNDCGATFARKFQLINHGKLHGRVPHSCTVCGREFLQKRTLATHMKTHTGEASFPCLACGEGFASKAELNAHNRLVHGGLNPNAPNTTIVTNKTATVIQQQQNQAAQQQAAQQAAVAQQQAAQQQAAAHQAAQSVQVQQQVAQQQQQQQQIEVQHIQQQPQTVTVVGNPNILTATISGETPPRLQYACRECGSVFNSREGLALHLRLHSGDKSLINDLCALTASIPGHLFQGVNQNQNFSVNLPTGTTFVTTQPGASSSPVPVQIITSSGEVVNQILQSPSHANQQHQQIQIQSQQQQQPQIKQQVVQQQAVQVTQQQQPQSNNQQQVQQATVVQITSPPQQKAKTHFCQYCGKSFVAKHGLMLHNKRHPDGSCTLRSHVCPECGKAFLQKNHLILHQRQHLEQNRGGKSGQQQQLDQGQNQGQQNGEQQGQQQITIQQTGAQQAQSQGGQQIQLATRNVLMPNQQVLQVLPDGGTWVKYEIIQSDQME